VETSQPKIVLHDHLDGGVRADTAIELADAAGVELPTNDVDELRKWFTISPGMPFDEAWKRFHVVIATLQSEAGLRRMAREAVEDLAADGVVYAELRFAPLNHLEGGLTPDDVLAAVTAGLAEGEAATGCAARAIVCAIRERRPEESAEAARLAVAWKGRGVVGFDLAGNEFDFGVDIHAEAFEIARSGGVGITVHAGEMAGAGSIAAALEVAQPSRIGHGLRLVEDCLVSDGQIVELGRVAGAVHDAGIMLEVCVTSNSCLGTPVAGHPVRMYHEAGLAVSVNADDRAITTTTVSREYDLWRDEFGFTGADFRGINCRAIDAAFCDETTKTRLRAIVDDGWA
jgi:adenosine deaminase